MYRKPKSKAKIAIIGVGNVGATIAYTILMKNLAKEIHLIDINKEKRQGEKMDIADASGVENGTVIFESDLTMARKADIIIHTAGLTRFTEGGSRLDLMEANRKITQDIFNKIGKLKRSTIIIVVTNPVDCITAITQEIVKLPHNQIIGTGTALDTSRLHIILAEHLGIHPSCVEGFVLGEHGDSGFVAWSTVRVKGRPIDKIKKIDDKLKLKVEKEVRMRADEIIKRKKATYYGIAMVTTDLVESILLNKKNTIVVSTYKNKIYNSKNISLGLPAQIGRRGVRKTLETQLTSEEQDKLAKSAKIIEDFTFVKK